MSCTPTATGGGTEMACIDTTCQGLQEILTASCHSRSLDFFKGLVRKKAAS
jgi:hypothetical protein